MSYDNIEDITQYHLKYELLPIQTNSTPFTFKALTTSKTIEEIQKELKKYDIVIIKKEKSEEIQQFFVDNGIKKPIFVLE